IDITRGDVISEAGNGAGVSDQFRAHLLWMDAEPMLPGRSYEIKIGTQSTTASISDIRHKINIDTWERIAAKTLTLNEIGVCNV
ncbi:MAG: hypothetical protein VW709_12415, partial [Rickettsiales bacterium]